MGGRIMMKFPWITLKNIQQAAHEAGVLSLDDRERAIALAAELVLLSEMLASKVGSWADEIRRRT
jgi:hypothetical protein